MALDTKSVLAQIEFVLGKVREAKAQSKYDDISDLGDERIAELITLQSDTIHRFAPSGSQYVVRTDDVLRQHGAIDLHGTRKQLTGILTSLKTAYEQGFLQTVQELIHADLFGDLIEMARYLHNSGFKDPAAMLTGGVMEEHLRKLCVKNEIETTFADGKGNTKNKMINQMNSELYAKQVYPKPEMLQVTAWAAIRNDADHGNFAGYTKEQVDGMILGVLGFLSRHPA